MLRHPPPFVVSGERSRAGAFQNGGQHATCRTLLPPTPESRRVGPRSGSADDTRMPTWQGSDGRRYRHDTVGGAVGGARSRHGTGAVGGPC